MESEKDWGETRSESARERENEWDSESERESVNSYCCDLKVFFELSNSIRNTRNFLVLLFQHLPSCLGSYCSALLSQLRFL